MPATYLKNFDIRRIHGFFPYGTQVNSCAFEHVDAPDLPSATLIVVERLRKDTSFGNLRIDIEQKEVNRGCHGLW